MAYSACPRAAEGATGNREIPPEVQKLLKTYEYDHAAPLNAETELEREMGGYTAYRLAFDSTNGERVPALLYLPAKGEAPFPCVIMQHGYNGDKSMGGMFAGYLAPMGYALISIDAQYHGERREEGKDMFSTDMESDVRGLHQTVTDLSRAIDYLESRGDIDPARIGYVGVSMGSFIGGVFAGVDDRVRTAILIVGGGDWEVFLNTSEVGAVARIREFCGQEAACIADFAAGMAAVEMKSFVGLMPPRPLLMINCENDKFVPKATGEAMFAAAGEPKEIRWYTCAGDIAHFPPIGESMSLMKKWFRKFLAE
ncbi:MAG: acetylxylan esterase [bacterium]